MSELTAKESAWLGKLQRVLDSCPSKRLGFYTIGDPSVSVYDTTNEKDFDEEDDFCAAVDKADARLGELLFPSNVHSTAG